jgi:hypothetical protein
VTVFAVINDVFDIPFGQQQQPFGRLLVITVLLALDDDL